MRAYDIIAKKRDGQALSKEEISFFVDGFVRGEVADYQASAFLMAVRINGMSDEETVALTKAMLHSGGRLDLGSISAAKVDKHSTGGVGDKVSIILAPLAASMGMVVPKLSGRGLGHTGGTLDKLESIPGFKTNISTDQLTANLKEIGIVMAGHSDEIAPADRKLYALRDVTATVDSVPLIASSIMSKKLAEGLDALLLDVKTGSGALMTDLDEARRLATTMVSIGNAMGVKTIAVITAMDQPLGRTVGNSLEVKECISALRGKWADDLKHLTVVLAAWMLNLSDAVIEEVEVREMSEQTFKGYKHEALDYLGRGDAFKKFVQLVDAQHGEPEALFNLGLLPLAAHIKEVPSPATGHVRRLDAGAAGAAAVLLGAGRAKAGDRVDPAAGIVFNKKVGETINQGEPLAMLHYNDGARVQEAMDTLLSGIEVGQQEAVPGKTVLDVVLP